MTTTDILRIPQRTIALLTIFAAVCFFVLFRDRGIGGLDFWYSMAMINLVLAGLAAVTDHEFMACLKNEQNVTRHLLLGIVSAAVLYAFFFAGDIAAKLIIPSAAENISAVYSLKTQASLARIILLITLVIGPGEELFWRIFLQRNLALHFGKANGLALASAAYCAVHISSGNPMLLIAAAVCGIFWGILYLLEDSPICNIISHVVWDLAVFVAFPF